MSQRSESAITLLAALAGGLILALIANETCDGDTSFDPKGSGSDRDLVCRAADLPGLPGDAGEWLAALGVFGAPAAVAALVWLVSPRTPRYQRLATAAALAVVAVLVAVEGQVRFLGAG